ncbi:S41 family peptidase [Candidatus Bariatricus faecipullorum]
MEEQHSNRHFWKGALAGALAMFLVTVGALGWMQFRGVNFTERLFGAGVQADAGTEQKLQTLKNLIDEEYLYSDEVEEDTLREGIYTGYINALGDPYSVYYDEEETQSLMESTSGEYSGIGVVMSQNLETGITTAAQVYENSPAKEVGMEAGDIIYQVDGEDVTTLDISEIAQRVRGTEGTTVEITVLRGEENEEVSFTIERRQVEVTTVESEMLENQTGYIRITEFDEVTYDQFTAAFENLEAEGMQGLIVDLRDNPGGNLLTVSQILDRLLPEGVIVYTEDKNGEREYLTSDEENKYENPVAVLVNGNSASASEIFAGAIQDYELGPIVGTTTYGKGVVQRIIDLGDGTCVKLTVSEYFTPNGRSINGEGITPDVEAELQENEENPEADSQLDTALSELEKRYQQNAQ